jgi:chitin deacetylase
MYPTPPLNLAKTPQAWLTAYNNVMQAGLIPNVSVSKMGSDGNPAYPNGQNPNSAAICSFTYGCNVTSDLFNAPDGMIGISFDDGPLPTSPPLYDFLKSQGQKATHFFIGSNIHVRISPSLLTPLYAHLVYVLPTGQSPSVHASLPGP